MAACALAGLSKLTNPERAKATLLPNGLRIIQFLLLGNCVMKGQIGCDVMRKSATEQSQAILVRKVRLTKAFALVCGTVNVYFGTDHISKRHEHLGELRISKLLRQVVDEQVAALWSCNVTFSWSR